MLGFLHDIKVAEINYQKGSGYIGGDWHLAIHHNDNRDTIGYEFFYNKESAIDYARRHGVRSEDIYVSKGINGKMKSEDVRFTCSHCGCKFNFGGGVLNYDEKKFPVCRECAMEFLKARR